MDSLKTKKLLSFVVPCFNEELSIPLLYKELIKIIEHLSSPIECEFIFVDDGSTDKSVEVLKKFVSSDDRFHYITFSRNFGKESAMFAGLLESKGDYVVLLDADLQHPPSLIPQLLKAVREDGFDCAITKRTRTSDSVLRTFFSCNFYRLMEKLTDIEIIDGVGDFRLMSRKYVDAVLSLCERNRFSKGIFPWIGFKTKCFEFENRERIIGETKWPFKKLFLYSLDGIFAFSSKLLSLASLFGLLLFLVSIIMIIYIIIHRIGWGSTVDGWSSMACIILFCAGIQLFSIGILGQYLAKTYTEVKQRPHFIISEKQ
jgi:glycosyltransferase involved in cell wall biosynthesis